MITERKFSIAYTSLWREITPSADNFIRHINLASIRFIAPYDSISLPGLNGAINETAFRLSRKFYTSPRYRLKVSMDDVENTWNKVCKWLGERPEGRYKYTEKVWTDTHSIADNIYAFLRSKAATRIAFEPEFPGCGFISQCNGDILVDDMLVEVKAGARGFRATDLRQVFVYCALARATGKPDIKNICLMNPRWGVSWASTIEEAATSCGASSSAELFDDISRGAFLLGVSN